MKWGIYNSLLQAWAHIDIEWIDVIQPKTVVWFPSEQEALDHLKKWKVCFGENCIARQIEEPNIFDEVFGGGKGLQ